MPRLRISEVPAKNREGGSLRPRGLPCEARVRGVRPLRPPCVQEKPGGVWAGRDGVRWQSAPGAAAAANPDVVLPARPLPAAHFAASLGVALPPAPVLLPVGFIGDWPHGAAQCLKKTSISTDGNSRSIPEQGACTLLTRSRPSTPKFSGNWSRNQLMVI
jgi:hypothetical protein